MCSLLEFTAAELLAVDSRIGTWALPHTPPRWGSWPQGGFTLGGEADGVASQLLHQLLVAVDVQTRVDRLEVVLQRVRRDAQLAGDVGVGHAACAEQGDLFLAQREFGGVDALQQV